VNSIQALFLRRISMFTLAATVGARAVARRGVLPTRVSALDESASMDILCSDTTGTLTRNKLSVAECHAVGNIAQDQILAMAAFASADSGADPVDAAIREAAREKTVGGHKLHAFTPFDPATKMAKASVVDADARALRGRQRRFLGDRENLVLLRTGQRRQ
jgi:H+-transporting ATPase